MRTASASYQGRVTASRDLAASGSGAGQALLIVIMADGRSRQAMARQVCSAWRRAMPGTRLTEPVTSWPHIHLRGWRRPRQPVARGTAEGRPATRGRAAGGDGLCRAGQQLPGRGQRARLSFRLVGTGRHGRLHPVHWYRTRFVGKAGSRELPSSDPDWWEPP